MLILASWLSCGMVPPVDHPDVLILTVDTLRADRLGFSGHPAARTPHLDRLARSGRVFERATTPLPRTTPALASLHTGLDPHHHGSREVGTPVNPDVPTLAGRLRAAGFTTVGLSAMQVAGPDQGLDRGFDTFEVLHDAPAVKVIAKARAHLDTRRPLFLWVHLADPHFPYLPDRGPTACSTLLDQGRRVAVFSNRNGRSAAALDACKQDYDDEIARVDTAVGSLLDGFLAREKAYVVFSADHGENQGERGLYYEHGPNVHDASLRVPFVVVGPGVSPGVDRGTFALTDVAPTLLAALGLPELPRVDGVDASARWRGAAPDPKALRFAESGSALHVRLFGSTVSGRRRRFCVNDPPYSLCRKGDRPFTLHRHDQDPELAVDVASQHPEVRDRLARAAARWPPETARERTVRTDRFKLVARPSLEGGYTTALYDVVADPNETTDVSDTHAQVRSELTAALDTWDAPRPDAPDRDLNTIEALRALGYVQ